MALREVVELTPTDVYSELDALAQRARQQVVHFLAKAGVPTSEVTHLLFAGGVLQFAKGPRDYRSRFS